MSTPMEEMMFARINEAVAVRDRDYEATRAAWEAFRAAPSLDALMVARSAEADMEWSTSRLWDAVRVAETTRRVG